jgi:hypothetical protein
VVHALSNAALWYPCWASSTSTSPEGRP